MKNEVTREFRRETLDCDVVVVGGGIAGTCAAIAAARSGARTVLVQDRSVLGGNGSSEVRVHIGGASEHGYHYDARESGIIEEIRLESAVRDPYNTYSWIDTVLYTKCAEEPNLTLLLDTHVDKVESVRLEDATKKQEGEGYSRRIVAVEGLCNSNETRYRIQGKIFIDGTGHGTLGYLAGASFRMGREGRSEFGESLAPDEPDNATLGASILFRAEDMGRPVEFHPPSWAKDFSKTPPPRGIPGKSGNHDRYWHADTAGWWWVELGGNMDTIKDTPEIRHELQSIVLGIWDYIKNHHPSEKVRQDARNFDITWIGSVPGHRESRRIVGDYILKQDDLTSCKVFDDQVAVGGWSMDLHPPGGFWDTAPSASHLYMEVPYTIPFRSIYSKDVSNLFMGSRCISASHVAHGSTRLIATLSLIGQAAGAAAAMCCENGYTPRDLLQMDIKKLQQRLLKDDQWLVGISRDDPDDKALHARISATSEYPCRFDQADKWIPLYFPIGQKFPLPPSRAGPEGAGGRDDGRGDEGGLGGRNESTGEAGQDKVIVSFLMKNETREPFTIAGGLRRDEGRLAFVATDDIARFTARVPANFEGWVEASLVSGSFDFSAGGNYWLYLDELDEDGLYWGMHCFHWPGTRLGFFFEEERCWKVHRLNKVPFYDSVFGPRGTMCFEVQGVPSPYSASYINNGFERPHLESNLWISAPFREPYRSPYLLRELGIAHEWDFETRRDDIEIVVDFDGPTLVSQVWLVLDTDLDAPFPHQDYGDVRITDWPIIGKAASCIAEMDVFIENDDGRRELVARFDENYQRIVKLVLDRPAETSRLVLVPRRNWGFHCFNLYGVRVY